MAGIVRVIFNHTNVFVGKILICFFSMKYITLAARGNCWKNRQRNIHHSMVYNRATSFLVCQRVAGGKFLSKRGNGVSDLVPATLVSTRSNYMAWLLAVEALQVSLQGWLLQNWVCEISWQVVRELTSSWSQIVRETSKLRYEGIIFGCCSSVQAKLEIPAVAVGVSICSRWSLFEVWSADAVSLELWDKWFLLRLSSTTGAPESVYQCVGP